MLTSTHKDDKTMSTISEKIEELKEDFSLFIESGFVGVKQLDGFSASSIFIAAQMISPNNTAPQVGLGYIALNKLELKEATHIFEKVMEKEPDNHLAQTFLGICYLLQKQKRKKGEKLINESIDKSTETVTRLTIGPARPDPRAYPMASPVWITSPCREPCMAIPTAFWGKSLAVRIDLVLRFNRLEICLFKDGQMYVFLIYQFQMFY
jgi:hypothetical protein